MADTKIEYCDKVWNVVAGCTKCSPGCLNCYAERMAKRQVAMGCARGGDNTATWVAYSDAINPKTGKWSGNIALRYNKLEEPLHWREPKRIFVCSMSDLFHEKVPFEFIDKVFAVIALCPQHTFLVLTKRDKRAVEYMCRTIGKVAGSQTAGDIQLAIKDIGYGYYDNWQWPLSNIHLGVSISNQVEADEKIPILLQIPAAVRWLSIEPMLGPIQDICHGFARSQIPFNRKMVDGWFWEELNGVVVGGESGPGARPMHPDWVRNIRDQFVAAGVPFFFKQWGKWGIWEPIPNDHQKRLRIIGTEEPLNPKTILKIFPENAGCTIPFTGWAKVGKKKAGCMLDGKEWKQLPERK